VPAAIVEKATTRRTSRQVFLFVRRVILSTGVSEFEGEQEYETEPAPHLGPLKSSRPQITIAVFILLALIGAGAAFFWYGYDSSPSFKSETAPPVVSLKTFEEYQQATDGSLPRDHELLKIQDAQLKRMSDQVLQLIMKLDLFESNVRNAQAAIPVAPKAAPKKPAEKPRISTGGAPLPPAVGSSEVRAPTNPPQ
jgi:hypothetical protein